MLITSCFCARLTNGLMRGSCWGQSAKTGLEQAIQPGLQRLGQAGPQPSPRATSQPGHGRSLLVTACHTPAGLRFPSPLQPSDGELVEGNPHLLPPALGHISGVKQSSELGGTNMSLDWSEGDGIKILKPESGRNRWSETISIFTFAQS